MNPSQVQPTLRLQCATWPDRCSTTTSSMLHNDPTTEQKQFLTKPEAPWQSARIKSLSNRCCNPEKRPSAVPCKEQGGRLHRPRGGRLGSPLVAGTATGTCAPLCPQDTALPDAFKPAGSWAARGPRCAHPRSPFFDCPCCRGLTAGCMQHAGAEGA
jgi:hypothetical protein